jgi:hypothetical protein
VVSVCRQGIATKLIQMCEANANADEAVSAVALHVDSGNARARALYESVGYRTIRKGDASGWEALTGIGDSSQLVLMLKVLPKADE